MTTEKDKEILKDLSARLPYGIKARYFDGIHEPQDVRITKIEDEGIVFYINENKPSNYGYVSVEYIKQYLRSMDKMSIEEESEYIDLRENISAKVKPWKCFELINWLNEHHFDYNELIKKGLALEAPDNMYNKK